MITHNGKQVTLAMRNRKAINLIARNGKAMFGELRDPGYFYGIDAAAKAVILAEYGKQVWSDVRDYAIAHPQIVEFINQDPHLFVAPRYAISEASGKTMLYVCENAKEISIAVYGGTSAATSRMEVYMDGEQVYNKLQSETAYGNSGSADGVSLQGIINTARMTASADWWRIKSLGYVFYDGKVYTNQEQILNIPRSATRQEFSLIGMAQP